VATEVGPAADEDRQPPVTVLVVDDDEPIMVALAVVIRECGYATLSAGNGREALEMALERRPALIFTDLMMPIMDGAALVARVRADAAANGYPTPPIVIMSALRSSALGGVGADALLRKPFDLGEVEELLKRFVGDVRGEDETTTESAPGV
jgi:CheY-like chemotaxis protein